MSEHALQILRVDLMGAELFIQQPNHYDQDFFYTVHAGAYYQEKKGVLELDVHLNLTTEHPEDQFEEEFREVPDMASLALRIHFGGEKIRNGLRGRKQAEISAELWEEILSYGLGILRGYHASRVAGTLFSRFVLPPVSVQEIKPLYRG